ncbi:carotenoid 1,2-hydratase [Geomonas nitrogeniifigens]|uniref:lipocalin-like domain-containing protein n=1 Tax=Geomonas diazotrophica TaxID=2843197 RepID=UPI001C2BF96C|nr:lipocalin-like domain-containing protein [Geomonas nitrogeniifigens]QXE88589.1 carotenoid 1,2-hydratase [Geomonas nitrogeniifigens]
MRRLLIIAAAVILAALLLWYLWSAWRPAATARPETFSVTQTLGGGAAPGYLRADKPRRFSFPADHGPHPGFRNEWWYFTGNLRASDGRRFGYQLTFFKTALTPGAEARLSAWGTNQVYMAHFAVTDVAAKRFRFAERFSRGALGLADAGGDPLAVRLENWAMLQNSARPWGVRLTAAEPDMDVDFNLVSVKPEILNGAGGLSRKGGTAGNASYYYSIPRMATSGTLRIGKERFAVSGLSWLDREWSTSALEQDQVGWDWFALQLDDGRDVMFYRLRKRDGSSDPFSGGTLVAPDGRSTVLKREDVQLEVVRWWESPASRVRYPSVWRLRVPAAGIALEIEPRLADQELLTGFRYWEGAVAVRGVEGSPGGSGYLEMTGYSSASADNSGTVGR